MPRTLDGAAAATAGANDVDPEAPGTVIYEVAENRP